MINNYIKNAKLIMSNKPKFIKLLFFVFVLCLINISYSNAACDFDGLSIDKIKEEIILDGVPVNLSTSEFEALILFVDNNNQVLDREFLVENLRGIQWQTFDRSVDVLVSRLRSKLGETPTKTRFLKTVHGVGYKFVAKPKNI